MNADDLEKRLKQVELILFPKRMMNISELSEYIGMSEAYIYRLTSTKKIPFSKPLAKMIFFDRFQIDEWLNSNQVSTQKDTERKANGQFIRNRSAS
jgi:excisionase family DNA binding protein